MSDDPAPQLADAISRAETPDDFHTAQSRALEDFDRLNSRTIASSGVKLACCAGCSLCCWLRVDVFAHEVFLIAHHIRDRFPATEIAELTARLAMHAAKVRALTPYEHAMQNIVCPLLRDGRCSIYEVRPQACRRHHSRDLGACQFTYDHPTDLEFPGAHDRDLFRTLSEAMQEGIDVYAQLGFDETVYELGTALAEALQTPSRWQVWRDRGRAFLSAAVTPTA